MPKGIPNKRYTPEFKKQVVEAVIQDGLSYQEAARIYEVQGHGCIQSWERIYLEEGPEGLAVERLHVKRLAAGQGMRRRQRKEEMLLPVFRAGYARLLDRMRQDDQLVNAVPQRNLQRRLQPLHRAAEGGLDTGKGHHDPEAPGIAEMLLQNFKMHD